MGKLPADVVSWESPLSISYPLNLIRIYKILIGLGIGAITGSLVGSLLYSLLNKNKDSQRPSSDSDNLTIDDFMFRQESPLSVSVKRFTDKLLRAHGGCLGTRRR